MLKLQIRTVEHPTYPSPKLRVSQSFQMVKCMKSFLPENPYGDPICSSAVQNLLLVF
jgi:hypothetical protein